MVEEESVPPGCNRLPIANGLSSDEFIVLLSLSAAFEGGGAC